MLSTRLRILPQCSRFITSCKASQRTPKASYMTISSPICFGSNHHCACTSMLNWTKGDTHTLFPWMDCQSQLDIHWCFPKKIVSALRNRPYQTLLKKDNISALTIQTLRMQSLIPQWPCIKINDIYYESPLSRSCLSEMKTLKDRVWKISCRKFEICSSPCKLCAPLRSWLYQQHRLSEL